MGGMCGFNLISDGFEHIHAISTKKEKAAVTFLDTH